MSAPLFTLLEYDEEDLTRRKSESARPEFLTVPLGEPRLSREEDIQLQLFLKGCQLDRLLYHEDTDFHCQHFTAPTGYAATFHEDTTFQPALFEQPFRILVMCSFQFDERFKDADINRWKACLNAIIPDKSPDPPIYGVHEVEDGWIPSLGAMSWIGIGDQIHSIQGPGPRCVYILAGLDPVTVENLHMEFYDHHHRSSTKDVLPLLHWAKEICRENARRLLYMTVTYLGLTCSSEVYTHVDSKYAHTILDRSKQAWLKQCGIEHPAQVYGGCTFPDIPPKDCPDYPSADEEEDDDDDDDDDDADDDQGLKLDETVRAMIPEVELFIDDFIPYPHTSQHMLRLSNCCALEGKVTRIQGPDDDIVIYNVRQQEDESILWTARYLHAYPSQVNPRYTMDTGRRKRLDRTWLTKDESNPYITSLSFRTTGRPLPEVVDLLSGFTTLKPQLIRITSIPPAFMDHERPDDMEW